MSSRFWRNFIPSRLTVKPRFKGFTEGKGQVKGYETITFEPFVITGIPWIGSSFVVYEFHVSELSGDFTINTPVNPPPDVDFCLAVRWDKQDGSIERFKLWENVGELLSYPLYNGETICKDCVFEVWTTEDSCRVRLKDNLTLKTSLIVDREKCCDTPGKENNFLGICQLFVEMDPETAKPVVFNQECFNFPGYPYLCPEDPEEDNDVTRWFRTQQGNVFITHQQHQNQQGFVEITIPEVHQEQEGFVGVEGQDQILSSQDFDTTSQRGSVLVVSYDGCQVTPGDNILGGDTFDCYPHPQDPVFTPLEGGNSFVGVWVVKTNYLGVISLDLFDDEIEGLIDPNQLLTGGQGWVGHWVVKDNFISSKLAEDDFDEYQDGVVG